LRFNFRGVGRSTGTYDGGDGEQDDARAALAYLQQRSGVPALALAGYSFGAMVALRAGATAAMVDRIIAVAPPLAFTDLGFLNACATPKLFIVGDRDQYCSTATLIEQLAGVAAPQTSHVISGADHFFLDHVEAIIDAVHAFAARA
jgi:uncharacterized protein